MPTVMVRRPDAPCAGNVDETAASDMLPAGGGSFLGNRKTSDLGDDDETADIDIKPTSHGDGELVDPSLSTALLFSDADAAIADTLPTANAAAKDALAKAALALDAAEAKFEAKGEAKDAKRTTAPWAPVVARLHEAGVVQSEHGESSEADDATLIRPVASTSSSSAAPSSVSPSLPPSLPPSVTAALATASNAPILTAPHGFAIARVAVTSPPARVRPLGASTTAEPLPDTIGRYRILRRLNTGEASDVLLAQSAGPGGFSKWVVIKRVLPHLVDDERAVDMFLREARIAARLTHSAIVQTYELGEDIAQGRRGYFIAMEYIDGISLTDIAQKAWAQGKSLPLELIAWTLSDIALGLQYAHEVSDENGDRFGLVHRDVCPDNVLVTKTGEAKLTDFGVATMANLTRFTRDGELRIKIPYTAPEQLKSEELDGRADLYSLGVSLYWLSTATMPFTAKGSVQLMQEVTTLVPPPPSAHNPTLPRSFDDVVMKLLAKSPAQRFATGEEVYEALLDAVPSSKNDVVSFWTDVVSPFATARTNPGALPKPGVPAARSRRATR